MTYSKQEGFKRSLVLLPDSMLLEKLKELRKKGTDEQIRAAEYEVERRGFDVE